MSSEDNTVFRENDNFLGDLESFIEDDFGTAFEEEDEIYLDPNHVRNCRIENITYDSDESDEETRKIEDKLRYKVKYTNSVPDVPYNLKFIECNVLGISKFVPKSSEDEHMYEILTEENLEIDVDLARIDLYIGDPNSKVHKKDEIFFEEGNPFQKMLDQRTADAFLLTKSGNNPQRKMDIISQVTNEVETEIKNISKQVNSNCITASENTFYKLIDKPNNKPNDKSINKSFEQSTESFNTKNPINKQNKSVNNYIKAIEKTFDDNKKNIDKHDKKPYIVPLEVLPVFPHFKLSRYQFAYVSFDSDPFPVDSEANINNDEIVEALLRPSINVHKELFFNLYLPVNKVTKMRNFISGLEDVKSKTCKYKKIKQYKWIIKKQCSKYKGNFFVIDNDAVYYKDMSSSVNFNRISSINIDKEDKITNQKSIKKEFQSSKKKISKKLGTTVNEIKIIQKSNEVLENQESLEKSKI